MNKEKTKDKTIRRNVVKYKSTQEYDAGSLGEASKGGGAGGVGGYDHVITKQVTKQVSVKNVGLHVLHWIYVI